MHNSECLPPIFIVDRGPRVEYEAPHLGVGSLATTSLQLANLIKLDPQVCTPFSQLANFLIEASRLNEIIWLPMAIHTRPAPGTMIGCHCPYSTLGRTRTLLCRLRLCPSAQSLQYVLQDTLSTFVDSALFGGSGLKQRS